MLGAGCWVQDVGCRMLEVAGRRKRPSLRGTKQSPAYTGRCAVAGEVIISFYYQYCSILNTIGRCSYKLHLAQAVIARLNNLENA